MLILDEWVPNQSNTIYFVLVDSNNQEVTGLGNTFVLNLSKNGAAFVPSAGTKSEIGLGWYKYVSTAGEANTLGKVIIVVTGGGIIQQNLVYLVKDAPAEISAALLAYVLQSGKTIQEAWLDIWATTVGNANADDSNDPTLITYESPDTTVQVTHTLTPTTRAVS